MGNTTTSDFAGGAVDATSTFNLVGDGTATGLVNGTNNNIVGTSGAPVDAHLTALGNCGGTTSTVGLLSSSAAVGAGANFNALGAPITMDQRGIPRVTGTVDIGAFQSAAPTITDVTRVNPTVQATNASSVTFGVKFNVPVQNVNAADFTVNAGTIGAVTQINPSTYNVTVNGLDSFNGTLNGSGTVNISAVPREPNGLNAFFEMGTTFA